VSTCATELVHAADDDAGHVEFDEDELPEEDAGEDDGDDEAAEAAEAAAEAAEVAPVT
jgi:hypothetical protein